VNVLVIDVGGTHVKILATGQKQRREFPSGPRLTPKQMVAGVKKLAKDWKYDAVSIGYPGVVVGDRPVADPYNLGNGWAGFDFGAAFKCPVKVINDAAMQALGSYKHGKMLFFGLGTGLGSVMVVDGIVEPMELGHLPYRKLTFEDYVGVAGRKRLGQKKWEQAVKDVIARLIAALEPEDVVLGGGNVKKLKSCLRVVGPATMPMHSWEDFAFGRKPLEGIALNPNEQFREPRGNLGDKPSCTKSSESVFRL